jgi:hypothetical protein
MPDLEEAIIHGSSETDDAYQSGASLYLVKTGTRADQCPTVVTG